MLDGACDAMLEDVAQLAALCVLEELARDHDANMVATMQSLARTVVTTASIGGVTFNAPPENAAAALAQADALLYEAKRGGRNRAVPRVAEI